MYGEAQNFKDSKNTGENSPASLTDTGSTLSYRKTNKLVIALFMVTDIMDEDEPMRKKLRTSGLEILSDTVFLPQDNLSFKASLSVIRKVEEVLYLLEVAEAIGLVSKMNSGILSKEFFKLKAAIQEAFERSEKFKDGSKLFGLLNVEQKFSITPPIKNENYSIGHQNSTRIGVQKGSTLMKALSDRIVNKAQSNVSDRVKMSSENSNLIKHKKEDFTVLKGQRRSDILDIIKIKGTSNTGVSILDIKKSLKGHLSSSSEKTLQRELVSMVADGLLKKTGSKRWSRYFLA